MSMRFHLLKQSLCLATICLALAGCTKKLEEDTANLKRETSDLKSKQSDDVKKLDELKSKLAQVETDLKALPAKLDPKIDASANDSKTRDAKISEDVAKMSGKIDQALAAIKKLEEEIVAMKQRQDEDRRKAEAGRRAAVEDRVRQKQEYAKASQVILTECKAALEAPPFKATSLVTQARKDFEGLRARMPDEQGTVVDEYLDEVIGMIAERVSDSDVADIPDRAANASGHYRRIQSRLADTEKNIQALLDAKE